MAIYDSARVTYDSVTHIRPPNPTPAVKTPMMRPVSSKKSGEDKREAIYVMTPIALGNHVYGDGRPLVKDGGMMQEARQGKRRRSLTKRANSIEE